MTCDPQLLSSIERGKTLACKEHPQRHHVLLERGLRDMQRLDIDELTELMSIAPGEELEHR